MNRPNDGTAATQGRRGSDERGSAPRRSSTFALPFAGALVVAALGVRSVLTERAAAERDASLRLAQSAAQGAGVIGQVVDLVVERAASEAAPGIWSPAGWIRPPAPRELVALRAPTRADHEGSFYLRLAERYEQEGRAAEARRLYRSVAEQDDVDPAVAKVALLRWSAHERAAGAVESANQAARRFLARLDEVERGRTREAVLLRSLLRPVDDALVDDLARCVGGADEGFALDRIASEGLDATREIAARRAELDVVRRVQSVLDGGARSGVHRAGDHLVALDPVEDGTIRSAQARLPVLPSGLRLASSEPPGGDDDLVTAFARVSDVVTPLFVVATERRDQVLRAADRGAALVLAALVLLVVGAAFAVRQTLVAARREAAAAAAKSRFVAQVGHDLRTPLALIRMYTETLASGRVTDRDEAREFAGVAAREAERLSSLVATVLDLARNDRSSRGRTEPVDLGVLARDVMATQEPLFRERGVVPRLDAPTRAVVVDGDPDALRGALGNLLENVRHHAAEGRFVEVEVAASNGVARIVVADRGPGVPADAAERVFERFVRGSGANVRGAGLGLALVREVAERHGGRAFLAPRAGGGAVFTVELPIARTAVGAPAAASGTGSGGDA